MIKFRLESDVLATPFPLPTLALRTHSAHDTFRHCPLNQARRLRASHFFRPISASAFVSRFTSSRGTDLIMIMSSLILFAATPQRIPPSHSLLFYFLSRFASLPISIFTNIKKINTMLCQHTPFHKRTPSFFFTHINYPWLHFTELT